MYAMQTTQDPNIVMCYLKYIAQPSRRSLYTIAIIRNKQIIYRFIKQQIINKLRYNLHD